MGKSEEMNLRTETWNVLSQNGKKAADVLFVTDGNVSCSFYTFISKANDIVYDSGFGGNFINLSLKVVGDGWWLERAEYDGSEWWEFKTNQVKKKRGQVAITIKDHFSGGVP